MNVKRKREALNNDEEMAILEAFRYPDSIYIPVKSTSELKRYCFLVEFLFLTGLDPLEVIALNWNNLWEEDRNPYVLMVNSRKYYMNEKVRYFLLDMWHKDDKGEEPIFCSTKGDPVNWDDFVKDYWNPIVECLMGEGRLKKYYPPSIIQDTFIINVLDSITNNVYLPDDFDYQLKRLSTQLGLPVNFISDNYLENKNFSIFPPSNK